MADLPGKKRKLRDALNIAQHLATGFARHGRLVARYPFRYILACLIIAIGCGSGLYFLHWETNIVRLWNPENSESGMNFKWLWKNHPPDLRRHSILFQAENILNKQNLKKMVQLRNDLHSVTTPSGYTWNDVCLKVPYLPDDLKSYISSGNDVDPFEDDSSNPWDDGDDFHDNRDPLKDLYPTVLCPVFSKLKTVCLEDSILELFGKDGNVTVNDIDKLSNQEILNVVNTQNFSEMFSVEKDFHSMLGDIRYNDTGQIISAGVASLALYGKMNVSEADLNKRRRDVLGNQLSIEQLDIATNEIEGSFIKLLNERRSTQLRPYDRQQYSETTRQNGTGFPKDHAIPEKHDILIERNVAKSFQEAVNARISNDIPKVLGSFLVMLVYVSLSLGKPDCFENRVYLAWAGLVSIIFALITSYGLCSYFGFVVSPLHNFIPFLLLGLGVDDMFVIVQALDYFKRSASHSLSSRNNYVDVDEYQDKDDELNTETIERGETERPNLHSCKGHKRINNSEVDKIPIEDNIAEVMSHSGVSITITSLTDFIAFAIGGTTSIPALRSFCMFCGVGIVSVYIYQITWFVAWLVIDERRKQAKKNAFLPFISHNKENVSGTYKIANGEGLECKEVAKKNASSCQCDCDESRSATKVPKKSCFKKKKSTINYILIKYGELLSNIATQLIIAVFTVFLLAVSIYGNINLKEDFDPYIFLPPNSSINTWMKLHDSAFPSKGELVTIFFEGPADDETGNLKNMNFTKFEWLVNELENQQDIVTDVDFWYSEYKTYYQNNFQDYNANASALLDTDFNIDNKTLVQFLFSQTGIKYKFLFDFNEDLECGGYLPHVQVHIMFLTHVVIDNSLKGIDTMNRIKSIIKKANFSYRVFPFSPLYSVWEIDEIIRGELYKNLGLATIAIYFATLVLLSDFKGSLYCLLSVILTLTNVSGLMYFWGLTVDTVTATVLIICIGLSVDFAAHYVHSFMQTKPLVDNRISNRDRNVENEKEENRKSKHLEILRYIHNEEKSYRMRKSLVAIAPAILHGGLSTILAVILLAFSEVYVFVSFFKIFVLVVVFGLYNGLVLLPILLANFGPDIKASENIRPSNVKSNQIALLTSHTPQQLSAEDNISYRVPQSADIQSNLYSTVASQNAEFHSDLNSTSRTKYHSEPEDDTVYKSDVGSDTDDNVHDNSVTSMKLPVK